MAHSDLLADHSKEKLIEMPKSILDMTNLKMLFLEGNFLTTLPDDIFWKLPKLMWLDLRNNMLESLPKSIGCHENLENLLLTNNNLQMLPNELGLVPKLKALQVSDNPLVYPVRKIVVEGTKAIKKYLKQQYEKLNSMASKETTDTPEDERMILQEEEVLSVVEISSTDETNESNTDPIKTSDKDATSRESLTKCKLQIADPYSLQPTLNVKKLQHLDAPKKKQVESVKIVHRISRTNSKIMLKSYFNKIGVRNRESEKIVDTSLKDGWLNQLRILLTDQERILQQERNLKALSDWRLKKQVEPTPKVFHGDIPRPEPPYGTHPEYSKMPTREELAAQLNQFFKEKGIVRAANERSQEVNVEKLVNDLLEQLKEMESTYDVTKSPRSEMVDAEKQMRAVMDIQRKLLRVKTTNNLSI